MKSKSAITGKFVTAKAAKASPDTTVAVSDYPTRQLRRLINLWEELGYAGEWTKDINKLIANTNKKMGWDQPKSVSRKHIVAKRGETRP